MPPPPMTRRRSRTCPCSLPRQATSSSSPGPRPRPSGSSPVTTTPSTATAASGTVSTTTSTGATAFRRAPSISWGSLSTRSITCRGHFSGIGDGYATAFDLFRCANGASTFSNAAGSYFSIDGCKTNLATFNSTGSGDRDDWASSPTSTDIQGAFLFPGVQYSISSADITALDVIGWGAKQTGGFTLSLPQFGSIARAVAAVPEPSTLTLLAIGALGILLVKRRP